MQRRWRGVAAGAAVLELGSGGGVVEATGDGVGPGGHVVVARVLVSEEQDIDGLARGDGNIVRGEGFDVCAVGADDGDVVAGDPEEHDGVHHGVHHPEQVSLAVLDGELERICMEGGKLNWI